MNYRSCCLVFPLVQWKRLPKCTMEILKPLTCFCLRGGCRENYNYSKYHQILQPKISLFFLMTKKTLGYHVGPFSLLMVTLDLERASPQRRGPLYPVFSQIHWSSEPGLYTWNGCINPPPPLHKPWLKSSFFHIKVAKGYENTHISPDAQGRGLCTHPAGPVRPYSLLQKRIYDFVQKIELRWIDSRESVTNWSKGQHSLHLYYLASNCTRMYI